MIDAEELIESRINELYKELNLIEDRMYNDEAKNLSCRISELENILDTIRANQKERSNEN